MKENTKFTPTVGTLRTLSVPTENSALHVMKLLPPECVTDLELQLMAPCTPALALGGSTGEGSSRGLSKGGPPSWVWTHRALLLVGKQLPYLPTGQRSRQEPSRRLGLKLTQFKKFTK